jgi:hypothetical protein
MTQARAPLRKNPERKARTSCAKVSSEEECESANLWPDESSDLDPSYREDEDSEDEDSEDEDSEDDDCDFEEEEEEEEVDEEEEAEEEEDGEIR